MYLHLGQDLVVRASQVVAIFDLENATIAKTTRVFLARAEKAGQVVNVTSDLPKSFVLCEEGGQVRVYITQVSSSTLRKRAAFFQGIANL